MAVSYASIASKPWRVTPEKLRAAAEAVDMVRLLLDAGADPNGEVGPGLYPPLHQAATAKGTELVQLLLQAGADPRRRFEGRPPSEYALNDPEVKRLLESVER